MTLDKNFFIAQKFSEAQLVRYKNSTARDLEIARKSSEAEVIFHFAFMGLIKIGICKLAGAGYRIKSRPGHHQKIIEYLSGVMGMEEILVLGDKMRKDRNLDFYSADFICSKSEAREYYDFVYGIFEKL